MLKKLDERMDYTQGVFRILLDCMARPGKINKIQPFPLLSLAELNLSPYAFGIGYTLLDQEVSFHIFEDKGEATNLLRLHTMAANTGIEKCDYLFINGNQTVDLSFVKRGTFLYPDESATVICQVDKILKRDDDAFPDSHQSGVDVTLEGPGIRSVNHISLVGLRKDLLRQWKTINREFPVGLDWILIDRQGRLCCIPRSTEFQWSDE